MAKAKRLPSGSWRVNQYVGKDPATGKRVYKSFTAEDKKTAEYLAAEYVATGKEKSKPLSMTVAQAISRYIEARTNVLSPSTIVSYRKIERNYLKTIMPVPFHALTQEQVQTAINNEAAHLSPKTVRCIYGLLTAALKEYYPDFRLTTKLPQRVPPKIEIPSEDAVGSILRAANGTPIYTAITLGALLGLRRSEIGALLWSDYDAKAQTLSINKAVVRDENGNWVVKAPKTYAGTRTLPLPKMLCQHLDSLPRNAPQIVGLTPDQISKAFGLLKKKHPQFTARFHDLRHYNASVMLAMGIPDKYAMERMGHATPNMLKTVYQHLMQSKRESVTNQMNAFAEQMLTNANMQHEMQHEKEEMQ